MEQAAKTSELENYIDVRKLRGFNTQEAYNNELIAKIKDNELVICIGTYGGAYGETTLSKTGQTLSNVLGELIYVFVDLLPIFVDKIKDFESSKGNLLFSKPNNFTLLSKYIILCKAQGNVLRAIYKIRNQREQHSVFMTLSTKSFLGFDNNGFKDVLPVKCPIHPSAPPFRICAAR